MAPKKRCYKKKQRIEEVIPVKPRNNLTKKRKIKEVILVKQRNNLTKKKRREREKRPWSDLPADLLIDIMVRNCSWADKIRLRAVCKTWQQLPSDHVDDAEINKLPWVVTVDWTDNLAEGYSINNNNNNRSSSSNNNNNSNDTSSCVLNCKLFHPKQPNPYSVNKILFKDRRRARICSSKHGWLLFEKKKRNNNHTSFFFLFSPFTQQFIHLPYLEDNCVLGLKSTSDLDATYATFSSSDPYNDPDCEFFVLRDHLFPVNCDKIAFSTCRRGDQNWSTRVFDKGMIQVGWRGPIGQPLYSTQLGYLCWFTDFHRLMAYSVTRKDWIQLINPQQMQVLNGMSLATPHLVECEGGLLVVMEPIFPNYDDGWRLFKFSWSSSNWNIVSSLPNQAIFVGRHTSFLVPASGDIANKIYYHDFKPDQNLKFYCLKDRQSHKYLGAAADDSLYRGWLAKGMLKSGVMWIQSS